MATPFMKTGRRRATRLPIDHQWQLQMKLIGLRSPQHLLSNLSIDCLPDCEELRVAIPYAEHGHNELLLFDAALRAEKPVIFYGRIDGTCPIDPKWRFRLMRSHGSGA